MTTSSAQKMVFVSGAAVLAGVASGAQAQDLAGPYAGLTFGKPMSGEQNWGGGLYSFDGNSFGAFAGYNMVNGDWVYGGELAFTNGVDVDSSSSSSYASAGLDKIIDLKARLGKAFGSTFVYGTVGYSMADLTSPSFFSSDADANGPLFGVGAETTLSNGMFIGAEILRRNLGEGGTIGGADASVYVENGGLTTFSIRAGFRF